MPLSAVAAQGDLLRSNPGGPGQGYVTRQGSRLIDPATNASFRFGGCNIYWMGLDENVGGVAHPTHFRITGSLATPDEGVYFAIVNADSGTAVLCHWHLGVQNVGRRSVSTRLAAWRIFQGFGPLWMTFVSISHMPQKSPSHNGAPTLQYIPGPFHELYAGLTCRDAVLSLPPCQTRWRLRARWA